MELEILNYESSINPSLLMGLNPLQKVKSGI